MQTERQAPRIWREIDLGPSAIPGDVLAPKSAATQRRVRLAEGNHLLEEIEDVAIRLESVPVQPPDFVVLVVRIVISELRMQELVTGPEHRDTVRQKKQAAEVLHLFAAELQNRCRHALTGYSKERRLLSGYNRRNLQRSDR